MKRGADGAFEGFWGRLGHHSMILALRVSASRIFLSWDLEPIWIERIDRHYRSAGWDGTAYAQVSGAAGEAIACRLPAGQRSCYLDVSPTFFPRRVEWGLYWSDARRLVILARDLSDAAGRDRTAVAWDADAGPAAVPADFDGYGPGRRFGADA